MKDIERNMTKLKLQKNEVLKEYFGYDTFRDGQEHLIDSILDGKDVVGIMPTGAGKSVCFQVPAMILEGITLVISPLISLMKDQVNALTQIGIKSAYINSSLTEKQVITVLDKAANGEYKLIYVAPERLSSYDFMEFVNSVDIAMVTIDEAHCISQWGQDFRPSYVKIAEFINNLKRKPVVSAFTATATQRVREDIISALQLDNPTVLITGFDRENLYYEVQSPRKKFLALANFLSDKTDKTGIVYCSTRKNVDTVCDKLNENGFNAARYHAGLSDKERRENQDDFLYDRVQIMVATNAFGMGIDKSNVSFVVHYNMPKDIESYYQEAGRAGRDGENADCLLLYSGQDVMTNTWLIENGRSTYTDDDYENVDYALAEELKSRDRQRLKLMTFYCTTNECLRAYILRYFGEEIDDDCGNCSNCNNDYETVDITIDAQKILSCVVRVKENYGINVVTNVLIGNETDNILRLGFNKLSTYGISDLSESSIKEIINFLVLNEYLFITSDKFPILKLGRRAREVLYEKKSLSMKMSTKQDEMDDDTSKTGRKLKKNVTLRPVNNTLFELLKSVRLEIAKEQKVPAFVIFSDSTLTDMCMKLPTTREEMLNVSGIGKVKFERNGERFLSAITTFVGSDEGIALQKETLDKNTFNENDTATGTSTGITLSDIEISNEDVTISVIADRINCYLIQKGIKKISGAKINDWLISQGYLEINVNEFNKKHKIATESGKEIGIVSVEREIRGEMCFCNTYGKDVQSIIIDSVEDIVEFCKK